MHLRQGSPFAVRAALLEPRVFTRLAHSPILANPTSHRALPTIHSICTYAAHALHIQIERGGSPERPAPHFFPTFNFATFIFLRPPTLGAPSSS